MAIVESRKSYDPRLLLFYGILGAMLLILVGGLFFRQLLRTDEYVEREKVQNQRRVLIPGPRGNITDREGRILVGNRPHFSAVLHLAELRREFRRELIQIVRNYRDMEREVRPSGRELESLARVAVAQRYLDQVNHILGRTERVEANALDRHIGQELLLPYILVDDLSPTEYARLLEQLPVRGPLQVYSSSMRNYPYGNAAAHLLGYVGANDELPASEVEGEDLRTFHVKGTIGRAGLEKQFDDQLQGQTGGIIYRVDPAGFKIDPPLHRLKPQQGQNLSTSIDIDLQLAAEREMGGMVGGLAVLEIATGEVLALSSKPDYDLNEVSPRMSAATFKRINEEGGWYNRGLQGLYPPGSTFKIVTACAALRAHAITPTEQFTCNGFYQVGNRLFECHNKHAHGQVALSHALEVSCNVYFYQVGLEAGIEAIAAEARRFHLDRPTGIELPAEVKLMNVPDPEWKKKRDNANWNPGDTANVSIGQGALQFTPLQMASLIASFARGEALTVPSILHQPGRSPTGGQPRVRLELPDADYRAIVDGLEKVIETGTAKTARLPGIRIAGKTGTAQKTQRDPKTQQVERINIAWFVCFAPVENPEIAIAIALEGGEPDVEYGGGRYSAPIAKAVLKEYFAKKERRANLQPLFKITAQP
ncbi:MAG: penicillin-binding protein 2 [Opitutaceae bacterium]